MGETVLEREDVKAWEVGLRALQERIAGRFGGSHGSVSWPT